MKYHKLLLDWSAAARRQSALTTDWQRQLQWEGKAIGFSLLAERWATPDARRRIAREAYRHADQLWLRCDLFGHNLYLGLGEAYEDAADILP